MKEPSAVVQGLSLTDLLRELPAGSRLAGDGSTRVTGVRHDSRQVRPGDLFVARRGRHADGGAFLEAAARAGAAAVLSDEALEGLPQIPEIRVADARIALALAAAAVYGHPTFSLDVIGITGTNGKTTTAHLVRAAIDAAFGRPVCGLIGTVGHSFGRIEVAAEHTTPEADELARILSAIRDEGASHVAMEVSSIALTSRRVHAIRFRVAAFTNLTQDHLDFHGTMHDYAEAKAELFTSYAPGSAVLHVGDPFGRALAARVRTPLVTVSAEVGESADVAPLSVAVSPRGLEASVRTPAGTVELTSPLFGRHNLENLLVALGIVVALDLNVARAAEGLRGELGAPGRLERCESADDDIVLLVDYAHTPDAVARVLASIRAVATGRVWVVFGCGGDRDPTKRAPMGEAAGSGADVMIVTNDNPRSESPELIARPITEGLRHAGARETPVLDLGSAQRGFAVVLDRAQAISAAVLGALPGDTVVVCGKGHETYQIIGGERLAFDDRIEGRLALAKRRARSALAAGEAGT